MFDLSTPIEYTKTRVNPNVNYGLWMIMMCPGRFINYTTWVGDTDNAEVVHVWGKGVYRKSLYLLLNNTLNLKLL